MFGCQVQRWPDPGTLMEPESAAETQSWRPIIGSWIMNDGDLPARTYHSRPRAELGHRNIMSLLNINCKSRTERKRHVCLKTAFKKRKWLMHNYTVICIVSRRASEQASCYSNLWILCVIDVSQIDNVINFIFYEHSGLHFSLGTNSHYYIIA